MNRSNFLVPALITVFGAALPLHAQMNVGDRPQLQFKATNGQQVSLEALRGRVVLVDFWATWCGPCMAQADHKVQIHNQWHDKGLQIVGVSLDQNQTSLARVVQEKGFEWPQYFDGQGWNNRIAKVWGVRSVPTAFLIDPDGQIVWTGHPAQIDRPIEELFQKNPPRLVDPQVLAQATTAMDGVMEAIETGDARSAIKLMGRVPAEAMQDAAFAERAAEAHQQLESTAQAMLDEVQPLIDRGEFGQATTRLQDLNRALAGTPLADRARQQLRQLMNNPEARSAMEAAERAARAEEALASAEQLRADDKHEQAYQRFRQIVRDFAGTDAAQQATDIVAEYEKDQDFVQQALESAAATRARGDLSLARSYSGAGRADLARERYQKIIDDFPGTTYAEQAQQELEDLAD